MVIKTEDRKNSFSYETSISDLKADISVAKIKLPYKKVREKNITKETKLKVTIEVLKDEI